MALNLGSIFAEVRLDTKGLKQGEQEIKSVIGNISSALGSIRDNAVGGIISTAITNFAASLKGIPEGLLKSKADTEQVMLGFQSIFEEAGKASATAWSDAIKEISESTAEEASKVEDIATKMGDVVADQAKAISDTAKDISDAGSTRVRDVDKVQQTAQQQQEDRTTTRQRQDEDHIKSRTRIVQDFAKAQTTALTTLNRGTQDNIHSFSEAMKQRDTEFGKSTKQIERAHTKSLAAMDEAEHDAVQDFGEGQIRRARTFGRSMDDIARSHQSALEQINFNTDREEKHFAQSVQERNADFGRENVKLSEDFGRTMKGIGDNMVAVVQDSADHAQGIMRQLGQTMQGIRLTEEQQNAEFDSRASDIADRIAHAKTPAEANTARQDSLKLAQQRAFAQRQIALQIQTAQAAAAEAQKANDKQKRQALDDLKKQKEEAIRLYKERTEELQRVYALDTLHQAQAHAEQLEDTKRAIGKENEAAELAASQARQRRQDEEADAREALVKKLGGIKKSRKDEQEDYEIAKKDAQDRFDEETRRAEDQAARQQQRAQEAFDEQVAASKEAYDRQVADAEQAYQRQSEDSDRRSEREVQGIKDALDEIERRYQDSFDRIQRAAEDSTEEYNRHVRDLTKEGSKAAEDLADAVEKANQQILVRTGIASKQFTDTWVAEANKVNEAMEINFRFAPTADIEEKKQQLKQFADEIGTKLPISARKALEMMQRLERAGIDPIIGGDDGKGGLLGIMAAMAQLPSAVGGIDSVTAAFVSLGTGQVGEFVTKMKELGVDLRTIQGLKWKGDELVSTLPDILNAVKAAWGPKSIDILRTFQGSYRQLVSNVEDLSNHAQDIIGEGLFVKTKAAISEFLAYMTSPAGVVLLETLSERIGTALGNIAETIFGWFRNLENPEVQGRIGTFLSNIESFVTGLTAQLGSPALQQAIGAFAGWLGDLANGIADKLKDPKIQADLATFFGNIGHIKDVIVDTLSNPSVQSSISNFGTELGLLGTALQTFGGLFIDAFKPRNGEEDATVKLAAIGFAMQDLANNDLVALQNRLTPLGLQLDKIAGLTWDAQGNLATPLEEAAAIIAPLMKDKLDSPAEDFKRTIADITTLVRDFRKMIEDFNNSPAVKVFHLLAAGLETLANNFLEPIRLFIKLLELAKELWAFANAHQGFVLDRQHPLDNTETESADAEAERLAREHRQNMIDIANSTRDEVIQAYQDTGEQSVMALETGFSGMPEVLDRTKLQIEDFLEGAPNDLSDKLGQAAADGVEAFSNELSDGFSPETLQFISDDISAWLPDVKAVLVDGMNDAADSAVLAFSDMPDDINEILHQIHGSGILEPWVETVGDVLEEGFADAVDRSGDAFDELPNIIGDRLAETSDQVAMFVTETQNLATSVVEDVNRIRESLTTGSGTGRTGLSRSSSANFNQADAIDASREAANRAAYERSRAEEAAGIAAKNAKEDKRFQAEQEANDRRRRLSNETMNRDTVDMAKKTAAEVTDATKSIGTGFSQIESNAVQAARKAGTSVQEVAKEIGSISGSGGGGSFTESSLAAGFSAAASGALAGLGTITGFQDEFNNAMGRFNLNKSEPLPTDAATTEITLNTGPIYNQDQGLTFMDQWADHINDRLQRVGVI